MKACGCSTHERPDSSTVFLRMMSMASLTGAVLSLWMPLVKVSVPGAGVRPVSAFDLVLQVVNAGKSGAPSACPSCVKSGLDLTDILRQLMSSGAHGVEYGALVFGALCGVLAYALLPVAGVGLFFKKPTLTFRTAVCACLLALVFSTAVLLFDNMFREQMQRSVAVLQSDPLMALAATFVGGIRIDPGPAAHVLVVTLFLLVLFTRALSTRGNDAEH